MKFGVVNKSTTVNRFVLHTFQHNITHLAVITRKSNIKLGILKRGGGVNWKRADGPFYNEAIFVTIGALFPSPPPPCRLVHSEPNSNIICADYGS